METTTLHEKPATFGARKLSAALGAEITGIDLREPIDAVLKPMVAKLGLTRQVTFEYSVTNERLLEIIMQMFHRGEVNKIRLANLAIAKFEALDRAS